MTDLSTRLESAPEGSRELSDEVLRAMGWSEVPDGHKDPRGSVYWNGTLSRWWFMPDGKIRTSDACHPTRSVDDALALVPEGWAIERMMLWPGLNGGANATVLETEPLPDGSWRRVSNKHGRWSAEGKDLACTISAALFRMKERERE